MNPAPADRVTVRNDSPVRAGTHVLYWMIGARRSRDNFALQHAGAYALRLGRPLLVFEPIGLGYRWASERLHRFVVQGMEDNRRRFDAAGVTYLPWIEPREGGGRGLLEALARDACVVVTDELPGSPLARMVAAAAGKLPARLETVDGVGLLPLRASERAWPTAASFRRHLQAKLPALLDGSPSGGVSAGPLPDPLPALARLGRAPVPDLGRWPSAGFSDPLPLDRLPPVSRRGGAEAGERAVQDFLGRLEGYVDRNHPDDDVGSGLSAYLHFGHVSTHRVVAGVLSAAGAAPLRPGSVTGSRRGWWGLDEASEGFLDQLVTWRELGHVFAYHRPADLHRFEGLPDWARATLDAHRGDPREWIYDLDTFAAAGTHDPVWNAAQRQLVAEGTIHGYPRMVWGKKILEWTRTPEEALDVMVALNDRYALDGRDPNSYAGIGWVLGRFDRPWGPRRPVFGTVRYMSSENTLRKLRARRWLARWSEGGG